MKLKPVNDKIVVKPMEKNNEEKTAGGIILPDTVQDGALLEGEVVAVGDGMYSASGTLIPVICDVGDTIFAAGDGAEQAGDEAVAHGRVLSGPTALAPLLQTGRFGGDGVAVGTCDGVGHHPSGKRRVAHQIAQRSQVILICGARKGSHSELKARTWAR